MVETQKGIEMAVEELGSTCDVRHLVEEDESFEKAKTAADAYEIYAKASAESKNKACIEAAEKLLERVKSEKCTHVIVLYGNENDSWYHLAETKSTEVVVGYLELMKHSILRRDVG